MKTYICGPMTGIPEFNFPAFRHAAEAWRAQGWEVVNPAELDEPGHSQQDWAWYLKRDLKFLVDCDAIARLPDWTSSRGARLEVYVAVELGLRVFDANVVAPLPATHPFINDSMNTCCSKPDYAHMPLWRHA